MAFFVDRCITEEVTPIVPKTVFPTGFQVANIERDIPNVSVHSPTFLPEVDTLRPQKWESGVGSRLSYELILCVLVKGALLVGVLVGPVLAEVIVLAEVFALQEPVDVS